MAALVGLVALLGIPTFFYVTLTHTRQLVEERGHMLDYLALTAATIIGENLRERSREVELLGQSLLYDGAGLDRQQLAASLARMQQTYPYYSWIGFADTQGVVQVSTGNLLIGESVAKRPWFQEAFKGVYVGDLHEAKLLAKLLPQPEGQGPLRFIDFSVGVHDPSGVTQGVLGVHAHWGWSKDLVSLVTPADAAAKGVEIFIVNPNNEIIFPDAQSQPEEDMIVPDLSNLASARYATWGDQADYLTAAAPVVSPKSTVPLDWKVVVRQPREKVLEDAIALQRAISIFFVIALVVFSVLAVVLGRQLGRPIQQLTRIAQSIAQGRRAQFNVKLRTNELRQLGEALQEMSSRLLANQRELEAAAHELERKVEQRTKELAHANQLLSALARSDALTGLPNRLAANEFLQHEYSLLKRRPVPYAVVLLDIDYFKKVNDTHGHALGDVVLQHVAKVLAASVRVNDFVGRVGGEEFMMILPMTTLDDALIVAEKLRSAVEAEPVEPVGVVTVSVGVALANQDDASADRAVNQADAMLYEAKRAGRNRVMPAPSWC